ncbi:Holliday junction branch migration protein RuvA [Atribacter laminatus]|uniref:Holliday junction branch migration complex subunit RuvA n=1 Tax=Atribacter laminatus TaxID=2847778 RepID=A0A7T1AMN6_ATRLM|nr:Holliday junction branch migration protein RuvA [Atribacter laminatus]QPM68726.1 Holliday junction ATP-dependent DNA helicase RuvA [Atribacter laminatus]
MLFNLKPIIPMFDSIRGTIAAIENDEWILETDWYGFRIKVTPFVSSGKIGEQKKLYIRFYFREDGEFFYYGFEDLKERETFDLICGVKGIGHKTALKILTRIHWKEFTDLILAENVDYLSSRINLSSKTVKRLLLELKPRLGKVDFIASSAPKITKTWKEVKTALAGLGYSAGEIEGVLNILWQEDQTTFDDTEILLKKALGKIGGLK